MENKRNTSDKLVRVRSKEEFKVKANESGLIIEGFANKNVLDRGRERVVPDAWELENFMKNPIILFNHGLDPVFGGTPIGKAVEVRPTEKGLYIRVKLSNSKSPLISMVRDLVDEKILRAFSVGFDSKEEDYESEGDDKVKLIKRAELFEVSVVGVPMNQDSIFEVSGKMLKSKSLDQIKTLTAKGRGAVLSEKINDTLDKMCELPYFNRSDMIKSLCTMSESNYDDLMDMIAGFKDVTDQALKAFADALELSHSELSELRDVQRKNIELEEKASEETEDKSEDAEQEKSEDSEQEKPEEETEDKSEDSEQEKPEEGSEDKSEDSDEAKSADDTEDKSEDVGHSERLKELIKDFVAQGETPDEAVIKAFAEVEDFKPSARDFKEFLEFADSVLEAKNKAQEEVEEKTEDADVETKQAEQEGVAKETTPIQMEGAGADFSTPFLDQAKQTNILLSTLVEEIRSLKQELQELQGIRNTENAIQEVKETEVSDDDPQEDSDLVGKAVLDSYAKRLEDIYQRLKKLD